MSVHPTSSSLSSSRSSLHRRERPIDSSTLSKIAKVALYALLTIASFALLSYPLSLIVSAVIMYTAIKNTKEDSSQPIFIPCNPPKRKWLWFPSFYRTSQPPLVSPPHRRGWFDLSSSSSRVPVGQITSPKKTTARERVVNRPTQEVTSSSRRTRIPVGKPKTEWRG